MQERLVEDWLTKVNERGFEIPFCQTLIADGHRILRVGHSPFEDGKDIISMSAKRGLHAYQLKSGDLDLDSLEEHMAQINALVEAAVAHPNVKSGVPHSPFFVTTGDISQPVLHRVRNLNATWRRRGLRSLKLISGRQLLSEFLNLSSDFWPVDPPKVRGFISLCMAEGKGDLNKGELATFLQELLTVQPKTPKAVITRRIAAANIFTSYALGGFHKHRDHWSIFTAWVLVAAHIAWTAEKHLLREADWSASFKLALEAAELALESLSQETIEPKALTPKAPELDDYSRARNTIAASALAAWCLLQKQRGVILAQETSAIQLIHALATTDRLWLWGESAVPHFFVIIVFLENFTATLLPELILKKLLTIVSVLNRQGSNNYLRDPYVSADDVMSELFEAVDKPKKPSTERACDSYMLEGLVLLAARRMLRQTLTSLWTSITKVEMASFCAENTRDMLLWRCDFGKEGHYWAPQPQSWHLLRVQAEHGEDARLPLILTRRPDFALMFSLVYPHRLNTALIKLIDRSFW